MIDLSHLTEEEQGVIMTVLRRDAELKKAEEERIRKLEKILNSGPQSESKLKYLSGEWFYEAKSRRHMDKIHGSEIILASMKQRKAASLDGSVRIERSKSPSGRGAEVVAPPKPARCMDTLQPQETNHAEKENLNAAVRSPRTPRHNPFNRASLIVVEPPENNDVSTSRDQESFQTEPVSAPKNHPSREAGQTSGGSITSDGSSVRYRPVPKKRTFLSRRPISMSESNGLGLDTQVGSAGVVPAPRRSLLRGSSGSSNQSCPKGQDETPQKSTVPLSLQASQHAQPSSSADETSQQPLHEASQVPSNSSLERERNPPATARDRPAAYIRGDVPAEGENPRNDDERDDRTQREHTGLSAVFLSAGSVQAPDRENSSSVGTATRQEELSSTQSAVDPDPPVSYDLNFHDKSDQQTQKKSNQKQVFKLSTPVTSPAGDEEDSIAKVLDWFSRSTDSNDWLNREDGPEAPKNSDISRLRSEDSVRKDAGDFINDRKNDPLEMKRSHLQRQSNEAKELRASDRAGNRESTETQEDVREASEGMWTQEAEYNDDESQPPKISHLKSFWEKSNVGPKILIGKSVVPSHKGQEPVYLPAEKDENMNNPHTVPDMPSAPGTHNGRGIYKYASNHEDEREHQLVISPQKDIEDNVHVNNNDPTYSSDYLKVLSSPQVTERRGSDTEILCVARLSPQPKCSQTLSPESETVPGAQPNPQPDGVSQPRETPVQEELSKTVAVSQPDADVQARDTPDPERLYLSRAGPCMDYNQVGNDARITSKAQLRRGSSEEIKRRDSEDKSVQSSTCPKRKEEVSNKDRTNSPHSNRQGSPHQDSTAEKIKQLKIFWEQERKKSMFYTGKPKTHGEGKAGRGANQAKLSKRFAKSEYDLRSIGNYSCSDDEDRIHQNFTVLPLNQRIDKSSPSLSTSRSQFNNLREFWDEASSDFRASFSSEKLKSPKRKEPLTGQPPSMELKSGDPEIYRLSPAVEKTRPAVMKSSPPPQSRSKSPHDRQTGSGSRAANDGKNSQSHYTTAETKRGSKDSGREDKSTKPQGSSGKDTRFPKNRKESFSGSSRNALRRATSMFALSFPDKKDQGDLKIDVSPVHSKSRKQRQNAEKGAMLRRPSEEAETLAPRARAFVPTDYRHYLGMTDETSGHPSPAVAPKDKGSEGKAAYDFDLSGPVRASTPVGSEDSYGRKGNKAGQRPLWPSYGGSDAGRESSVSSTSETWSTSRSSSNRENEDESQNAVRKALRRAEARPKNLAKSMMDITASLSTRQERRQDPTADLRRINDVSSIPSPSSSLYSDPEHLKKMSKSVPSFLQKEGDGRDADSACGDSYHRGRLTPRGSMTNLTSSPGMASASSLSGSVMTMYSGDFGNVEVQGNIQFSINYVQRLREFHIFVAECRDLAAVDPKRGRSDPYVKSYLVPDKANLGKRKTSVKKKTLNPTFNEILRYRVRMEYLRTQTLILSVWHHDTFGRNSFLGEVDVDLSKWDFDHTQMNYLDLRARAAPAPAPSNGRGEMRLAIRFLPQIAHSEGVAKDGPGTGEVHIWVKECKNLPLIRATIDPYVKCFVLPDTSRKSRQKTRVLRRTADPVFNHTMVYDGIRGADLTEACVELTVWDRDRLAGNLLGGLRLGTGTGKSYGAAVDWMDSTPFEVALWERMMASPNEWVEDVLPLRMVNSAKTAFK